MRQRLGAALAASMYMCAGCGGPSPDPDAGPLECETGQMECDGVCVDTETNVANCGGCGVACQPGQVCAAGDCMTSCPDGQDACDGGCFDLQSSRLNCGACGAACDAGEICDAGACVANCASGQIACGGRCVDPATDRAFCGATDDCEGANDGDMCLAGEVCAAGACDTSCPTGQIVCGDRCVDPSSDRAFCGASGDCAGANAGDACGDGEVCTAGGCATSCPTGQVECGGRCVDPDSDPTYCGASGDCAGANDGATCSAGTVCASGSCETSCPTGQVECAGRCVDPATDGTYCGASGDCSGANAGEVCDAGEVCNLGACEADCPTGQVACAGRCVDPGSDPTFCGASGACDDDTSNGTVCVAGQVCSSGSCVASCPGTQIACGGACIEPSTDRTYCGASGDCTGGNDGETCGAGTACTGGACMPSCGSPLSTCPSGCVDTRTDPANCGACGTSCAARANAIAVCYSPGTCGAVCNGGFGDCNLAAADGCEAELAFDDLNCGRCGAACATTEACRSGVCMPRFPTNTDLSVTRTQGSCADGGDMVSYAVGALTSTTATLSTAPATGCLAAGDRVMLISLAGSPQTNVGNYEVLTVQSVSGTTVTFTTAKARFYGTGVQDDADLGSNQYTVLQRVPTYRDVVVAAGVTLSAMGFDGRRGGVFALRATGVVTVNGTISMSRLGAAGGLRSTEAFQDGLQGSSYGPGPGRAQAANLGAGGGGLGEACASHGTSGGGASHLFAGTRSTHGCGGEAGLVYGSPTRAYLGSGGGGGGVDNATFDNPPGGFGGHGGGIILLWSPRIDGTGTIESNGGSGEGDLVAGCAGGGSTTDCWDYSGPGGGGSGGTLALITALASGPAISVDGGAGGLGGPAGNGGNGGRGVLLRHPRTCAEALLWNPAATDGRYFIDPDTLAGPVAELEVYCDMTNGGWTMIMATGGVGPDMQTATTPVIPGSQRYMPSAAVQALANVSTQVHIRTEGLVATESITSPPNALAIRNLRTLDLLNRGQTLMGPGDDPSAFWTGPRAADSTFLWHTCGPDPHGGPNPPYPNIYWACNNGGGIHITTTGSAWTSTAGTNMEVYVR